MDTVALSKLRLSKAQIEALKRAKKPGDPWAGPLGYVACRTTTRVALKFQGLIDDNSVITAEGRVALHFAVCWWCRKAGYVRQEHWGDAYVTPKESAAQ
jgi:hypothetical protein